MNLSIIIVNYNTKELVGQCLTSLEREMAGTGYAYEVIIVDNASGDGSQEMIKGQFPWAVLVENRVNIGFPKANNQVLMDCRGEFLFFLNPDTVVIPGSITGMLDFLLHKREYGAVGPKITRPDGSIQLECASNFPDLWNMFCELARLSRIFRRSPIFGRWRMTYWDHQDSRDVNCLLGAAIMMRRRIIDRIGPLDEHMYIEDVDLCYRILQDGWKIRYLTTAEIVHYDGASRKGSRKFYHHYQIAWTGLWYFFKKHKGPVQAMSFRLMTAIFSLLGVLLFSGGALFSLFTGKRSDSFADKLQKSKAVFLWSITPAACLKSDY